MRKAAAEGKFPRPRGPGRQYDPSIMIGLSGLEFLHPNTAAFKNYLQRLNVDRLAREAGLQLRTIPRILPSRIYAELSSGFGGMPVFNDNESFYQKVRISGVNGSERFLEFSPISAKSVPD